MMNDDMHELQNQLEEAGFLGDADDSKSSKAKILQIPGGKKIVSIFKKTRKKFKWNKKKDADAFSGSDP